MRIDFLAFTKGLFFLALAIVLIRAVITGSGLNLAEIKIQTHGGTIGEVSGISDKRKCDEALRDEYALEPTVAPTAKGKTGI